MADTKLNDLLFTDVDPAKFEPYLDYSPEADAINVYFRPDPDYSERLNEHVTLFRSVDDDSLVGCRIKGITGLVEDAQRWFPKSDGNWLNVKHDGINLRVIFWSFRGGVADKDALDALRELVEQAGDLHFEPCH